MLPENTFFNFRHHDSPPHFSVSVLPQNVSFSLALSLPALYSSTTVNTPQQSPFYFSTSLHHLSPCFYISPNCKAIAHSAEEEGREMQKGSKEPLHWLWQPQERKSVVSAQHCLNRSRSWWNDEEITQFHALHHLGQLHSDTHSTLSLTGTDIQWSVSSERMLWIIQPSSWLCESIINCSTCTLLCVDFKWMINWLILYLSSWGNNNNETIIR